MNTIAQRVLSRHQNKLTVASSEQAWSVVSLDHDGYATLDS